MKFMLKGKIFLLFTSFILGDPNCTHRWRYSFLFSRKFTHNTNGWQKNMHAFWEIENIQKSCLLLLKSDIYYERRSYFELSQTCTQRETSFPLHWLLVRKAVLVSSVGVGWIHFWLKKIAFTQSVMGQQPLLYFSAVLSNGKDENELRKKSCLWEDYIRLRQVKHNSN